MSDQNPSKDTNSFANEGSQTHSQSQDQQPESASINRQERMNIRQSSPTNPRVEDKPEGNQEEA